MRVSPLVEAAAFVLMLPFVWATRLCRGSASLFLVWIFGVTAALALGCALMATTGYIIGSVAMGSLWTVMVVCELARRYRTKPTPQPDAREPQQGVYDVFLADNNQDKPAVLAVAAALKRRGLLPWIDVEQNAAGSMVSGRHSGRYFRSEIYRDFSRPW